MRFCGVVALLGLVSCGDAGVCTAAGPPYAFHARLSYGAGLDRLVVVHVTAASGRWRIVLPLLDDRRPGVVDVEWGGAEPDGSLGTLQPLSSGLTPVVLVAEQDADGCPVTQYASVDW